MQPDHDPRPGERVFIQPDDEPLIAYYRWKARLRLVEARAAAATPEETTRGDLEHARTKRK